MQREMERGHRKGGLALAFLALTMGFLLLSGPALAVDKTWIANNGWWNTIGNWTPSGVPGNGDNVFLTQGGTASKVVSYRNSASSGPFLNNLTIDATGTGNMTLNQGGGGNSYLLSSVNEYVGYNGKGTHLQYLGTNNLNSLYLGYNPGSNGTYTLGDGAINASNAYLANMPGTTGTFTQSGGTFTVQTLNIGGGSDTNGTYNLGGGILLGPTINLNTGGTFNQTGGILWSNNFNQFGGTVTGTLAIEGAYNYNSGVFDGRLVNGGSASFNADFTAGNGVENRGTINIMPGSMPTNNWRNMTFNGAGLLNKAVFNMTSGALSGNGPLVNDAWMNLNHVTFWGHSAFTNNGILQVTNNANFETGYGSTFVNNGELRLIFVTPTGTMPPQYMPMADLGLPGDSSLENNGLINLNGQIIHDGTLKNNAAGIINGNGYILSDLVNSGVINMGGGVLNIDKAFNNTGTINLNGTLFGGTITNTGTIEGGSATVNNNIVNHGDVAVGGGKVTLTGTLTNASDGKLFVRTESKMLINQGLAVNDGLISATEANFDNNNHTLTNNGIISTRDTLFSTGGLINNNGGKVYFGGTGNGDGNRITGDVTNNSGGMLVVQYAPAMFLGNITNNEGGTFKVTDTHYTCLGTYTNHGAFISDPAINTFTDLIQTASGYLVGGTVNGEQDQFLISNDFINQSQQSTLWNTVAAYLAFTTGTDTQHQFYLPGADLGGSRHGFENNFAWGILDVTGQEI
ncbi:MAG: hypothetical protein WC443_05160, partial [Desulfobaccales bacterium]